MKQNHPLPMLIAGNWKMNLSKAEAVVLANQISKDPLIKKDKEKNVDMWLFPSFVHLQSVLSCSSVPIGGQNCSSYINGAHTGDVSAAMLRDLGCKAVIIGHSERRAAYNEAGDVLAQKIAQAHQNRLHVIFCVGETLSERESGREKEVVCSQIEEVVERDFSPANFTIAYEPVWAIGTGRAAEVKDIREMHRFIRETLQEKLENGAQIRILYGGSVKPANAAEIFQVENVNGALVGGASLQAEDFLEIARAALR